MNEIARVEIRNAIPVNGETVAACVILKTDDTISIETDDERLRQQLEMGVIAELKLFTPKDGIEFLFALTHFRSGDQYATKVLRRTPR